MSEYTLVQSIIDEVEIPANGILSRDLYKGDKSKVMVFGFDTGQELSEHTASMPAALNFIKGEAQVTLGDDTFDAATGTWIHMPPELKHSIKAKTPLVMLLTLFTG